MSDELLKEKEDTKSSESNPDLAVTASKIDFPKVLLHLKKLLIWAGFFGILYILRDLFGLIFITFILGFITFRINEFIVRKVKVSRKLTLFFIYYILIIIAVGLIYLVVPKIYDQAKDFNKDIPQLEQKVKNTIQSFIQNNSELTPVFKIFFSKEKTEIFLSDMRENVITFLPKFLKGFIKVITTIILSIIFSFLIVLDLTRVIQELKKFEATKLKDLYHELALPIVRFARVVGLAFEAQSMIAIANTVLTALGMLILGIKEIAFLSIIVFLCSFIPVLGVFISSVPIILVAFNGGGLTRAFFAIILVIIIHFIEAYILNPRIYAEHMKINPVFVLIILFLGHHLFGIWGMLLGVPVIYYFMTYIAGLRLRLKTKLDTDSPSHSQD